MKAFLTDLRDFFVSLRLTVGLLILSLILVFVATLDQVNLGIWAVQEKYFRSIAVMWLVPGSKLAIPVFPGGYFIGGMLLINLVCAHIYRFSFTLRKSGIQLAHAGLILLLIGELVSGLLQKDSSMRLEEGETKQYSESFRDIELAVIDRTDPKFDEVVAIPEAMLGDKLVVQHPKLPFQVKLRDFHPNAELRMGDGGGIATAGVGTRIQVTALPVTYKPDERNTPAALVEIVGDEGSLGTWIASPLLQSPQPFTYRDHTWEIVLRFRRYYKPFSLTLLKFSHDRYPGTEIPKNFSSRVRVKSDDGRDDREVLIYMNNPLRYGGLTFYQAGFERSDKVTILQVVRNPGWLIPYIACVLMSVGLVIQFGFSLAGFVRRRSTPAAA